MEEWKALKGVVPNGDNYAVSTAGRVKNVVTGQVLKGCKDKDGYLRLDLFFKGKRKTYLVHRIVATAFITNTNGKRTVNHKDGNKANNSVTNLEWATHSEQNKHASKEGLRIVKANKPVNQFTLNGELITTFESGWEASRVTGVLQPTINYQCRKQSNPTKYPFYFRYA